MFERNQIGFLNETIFSQNIPISQSNFELSAHFQKIEELTQKKCNKYKS